MRRIAYCILAGSGLAVAGCALLEMLVASAPPAAESAAPVVAVAAALTMDMRDEIGFSGEFRPYQQIDLVAQVPGFIKRIAVDVGDHVRAGEAIAELEIPNLEEDIRRAQADCLVAGSRVERLEAEYADAHCQFVRLSTVAHGHPGLLADQDIDDATAKDRAAAAALSEARNDQSSSQAALDRLINTRALCSITAPFAGVVTRRSADDGAFVRGGIAPSAPASAVIRLSQNDRLRLMFPVPEVLASEVAVGAMVGIHIGALSEDLRAPIARFTRSIDADTRTMEVECDIANLDLRIIPGMFATITFARASARSATTVPVQAIIRGHEDAAVLLVGRDRRLVRRAVKLGVQGSDAVQVRDGIVPGDLVVISNQSSLRAGMAVVPQLVALLPGRADAP